MKTEKVGQRIRAFMERKEMPLEALSQKTGLEPGFLSTIIEEFEARTNRCPCISIPRCQRRSGGSDVRHENPYVGGGRQHRLQRHRSPLCELQGGKTVFHLRSALYPEVGGNHVTTRSAVPDPGRVRT